MPPEGVLGYTHIGKPFYIDLGRDIQQRDPGEPYIEDDQEKAEIQYLENYAWRIGDVAVRQLADHAPVNYVWPIRAATGV